MYLELWQIGAVFVVGFIVGVFATISLYMWQTYNFKKAYEEKYGPQKWA